MRVRAPRERRVAQGLSVAGAPVQRMCGVRVQQQAGVGASAVVGDAHAVLTVHCIDLALGRGRREQGRQEEVRESIQDAREMVWRHVEHVDGVTVTGRSIALAPVALQKALVLSLVWKFLGAQKEHVLAEVREPRHVLRLVQPPHAHREGCRGLVAIGVGGQDDFHAVWQGEVLVGAASVSLGLVDLQTPGGRSSARREAARGEVPPTCLAAHAGDHSGRSTQHHPRPRDVHTPMAPRLSRLWASSEGRLLLRDGSACRGPQGGVQAARQRHA
mmetsp:Transcript_67832/g.220815  ORF Transcript_67832/g.220815 Transcript_67832/m.220815 type:complete len:273 (-) Transcript_67832:10-828(-)